MPRPADAKVWNEDLVTALRARSAQAQMMGKQSQFTFRDGADAIEAVRGDIYAFRTGRIVGLPDKLTKTIDNLCRAIIAGQAPIYPPGYVATQPTGGDPNRNPYLDDPYLKKIKSRGGAEAILLALYRSPSDVMTINEICAAAQPFCDELMKPDFHQGRMYAGWSSSKTLQKHKLIQSQSSVRWNQRAGGLRSDGPATYSLTRNGEMFVEALLATRPHLRDVVGSARTQRKEPTKYQPFATAPGMDFMATTRAGPTSRDSSNSKNELSKKDERELREWASTAEVGHQKAFAVGKQRRKLLHDLCEELNGVLRAAGRWLQHESHGSGPQSRALYVTMSSLSARTTPGLVTPSLEESFGLNSSFEDFSQLETKRAIPFNASDGHRLDNGGEGTPTKRQRNVPPSVAAANAALTRQAIFESKRAAAKPKQECIELLDSDDDGKMPAKDSKSVIPGARKKRAGRQNRDVIEINSESDDDDDIPPPSGLTKRSQRTSADVSTSADQANQVPPIDSTKPDFVSIKNLRLIIDNRERDRNATPRWMRMELTKMVSVSQSSISWPTNAPETHVEEASLSVGDFSFMVTEENGSERQLPVFVERKHVRDLVQRSFRKDHWKQLQCMRAMGGHSVLLIEGDFRTAEKFTAYGSLQSEDYTRNNHTIDNEASLLRFIGRALLSSAQLRFLQTKDVLGSLRAVAACGLIAPTLKGEVVPSRAPNIQQERQQLTHRLESGGIPFVIASCVSEEIGSMSEMDRLYGEVDDDQLRDSLLVPIIEDITRSLESTSSPLMWSMAIHKVYFSALSQPSVGRDLFEANRDVVEDEAYLLANIHSGMALDAAVNAVLDATASSESPDARKVVIVGDHSLHSVLPKVVEGECFYEVKTDKKRRDKIPIVTIHTMSGTAYSRPLVVFVLEGEYFVRRLKSYTDKTTLSLIQKAKALARTIRQDCAFSGQGKQILLVRGLEVALDNAKKKPEYQAESRFVVDMALAELMLVHDIVVLQAVRKSGDCEKMLMHLALACYHFQLLKVRSGCS